MHGFANPARFLRIARWLTPLFLLSGVGVAAVALAWGLLFAPPDRLMGETVRILFIHVPAAWLGMAGSDAACPSGLGSAADRLVAAAKNG